MRIRVPFACAFALAIIIAAYLGFTSLQVHQVNDKILHGVTFFVLTISFYWILDTTRRRTLNLTLLVVTVGLGLGSEIAQALLPNDHVFDPLDIAANTVGSLSGLGLSTLYHKRMLDRRRRKKGYGMVPQEGGGDDLELGDGRGEQEIGVTEEQEEAWDEMGAEGSTEGEGRLTPSSASAGDEGFDQKK